VRITVIAMNEGFTGAIRAGRFFQNGAEVTLEVLAQDADPPEVTITSADGTKRKGPDPERIGRKSFEAIKRDPRLKVLADGESQAALSEAAFAEMKGALSKAAAELAEVVADNVALRSRVTELEAKLAAALAAPAAPAPAPVAPAAPAAPAADASTPPAPAKSEGKGKAGK